MEGEERTGDFNSSLIEGVGDLSPALSILSLLLRRDSTHFRILLRFPSAKCLFKTLFISTSPSANRSAGSRMPSASRPCRDSERPSSASPVLSNDGGGEEGEMSFGGRSTRVASRCPDDDNNEGDGDKGNVESHMAHFWAFPLLM